MGGVLAFSDEIHGDLIPIIIHIESTQQAGVNKADLSLNRMGMNVKMFCL